MDFQDLLDRIHADLQPRFGEGRVADYIPELAGVDARQFGIAAVDLDGRAYCAGHAQTPFSIQSISKLFALMLALHHEGQALWSRVGREPSGTAFNSLVLLEHEAGIPRNPFINAGALVVTDVLCARTAVPEKAVLDFLARLSGRADLGMNRKVARSERETGHRNAALAHLMKSFGNLQGPVDQVLDAYCNQCAIEMGCVDLARAAAVLARPGAAASLIPGSPDGSTAKRLNALMQTCGTYDGAGDVAFRVGLPAKSGVGGGVLAVVPGVCGLCVWSPGLDERGNSVLGIDALERFTTWSGRSVF